MSYLIIILMQFLVHDFHFSRMEIKYNQDQERLECTLNVFIDDLETALKSESSDTLRLGTGEENLLADQYILSYLQRVISLSHEQSTANIEYIGKEISNDLMAFHIYFTCPWEQPSLTCENTLLMELFDDQKNMISYEVDGEKEQILLNRLKAKAVFE